MKRTLEEISISHKASILEALKQMDKIGSKILIVTDNKKFKGIVTIGDIQRAIIRNDPMDIEILRILRKNITIAKTGDKAESVKQLMLNRRVELMPVIDNENNIIKVYFWEDLFVDKITSIVEQFNLPVVIMAGGFGKRLQPLTNVLPKPLIPIGEKTIIENIFNLFSIHGCNNFYISVNYKSELIEFYLKNLNLPYNLHFFKEPKPLGTAGGLSLLKKRIQGTFFINNCDILIEQDYSEILKFHNENNNDITIVAAVKHFPIPYGIIKSGENGILVSILEKPDLTFKINSGMYILEKDVLNEIPENTFFHITELVTKIQKRGGKVGVFPVSEKSWKDIGDWDEYLTKINC